MSAYKTITIEQAGDGSVVFDYSVTGWRMDAYPANAQVSVNGLPANGTFDVELRPAGHVAFKEHILASGADDLVMLSGKEAPIFSALRVTVANTGGATVQCYLTLWERGI